MSTKSIWSASYVSLLVMNFLMALGSTISGTVLPLYADSLGATSAVVGFISGGFAVTAILIRPFAGPAFDSFPKKRLLLIAVTMNACALASYAFAASVPAVVAGRFLHGLGMGCTGPLGMALVSEALPRERMSSGVSYYALAFSLAQAIGPALGLWMCEAIGFAPSFICASASLLCAAAVIAVFVHEAPCDDRPAYKLSLSRAFNMPTLKYAVPLAFLASGFACLSGFMALYGAARGVGQIGLYFTVAALCLFVTRPVFGKLGDRLGTRALMVPGCVCFALSFALIHFATDLPMFVLAAVVSSCGYGAVAPLLQADALAGVSRERRGAASNTNYLGLDAGMLAGPCVGGLVVDAFLKSGMAAVDAYADMWLVMVVPIAVGLALYLALTRRK